MNLHQPGLSTHHDLRVQRFRLRTGLPGLRCPCCALLWDMVVDRVPADGHFAPSLRAARADRSFTGRHGADVLQLHAPPGVGRSGALVRAAADDRLPHASSRGAFRTPAHRGTRPRRTRHQAVVRLQRAAGRPDAVAKRGRRARLPVFPRAAAGAGGAGGTARRAAGAGRPWRAGRRLGDRRRHRQAGSWCWKAPGPTNSTAAYYNEGAERTQLQRAPAPSAPHGEWCSSCSGTRCWSTRDTSATPSSRHWRRSRPLHTRTTSRSAARRIPGPYGCRWATATRRWAG